jgi:hypothetical protein
MEIACKLKQLSLALVLMAASIGPSVAQNDPAELHDSGLTFEIRHVALEHEGARTVFRAILDNKTEQDWYMRSATVTLSAVCEKGLRRLHFNVHLTNPDLTTSPSGVAGPYATGNSIKPGQNDIAESVRADPTCKVESLGPVSFKALRPVDASTQQALDAGRRLRRSVNEANAVEHAADGLVDELQKVEADRQRAFCHEVYAATAAKKLSDLTVKEAQDVRTCERADYYK